MHAQDWGELLWIEIDFVGQKDYKLVTVIIFFGKRSTMSHDKNVNKVVNFIEWAPDCTLVQFSNLLTHDKKYQHELYEWA